MSELLVVHGPDIRLARSRVALVLAICAAARGRSVFAAESAVGSERGYAMAMSESLLGEDGVLTFPGAPAGRLTVAVRFSGAKFSDEDFSEGAAAEADLLVLSCDEGTVLPYKPLAEVLVTAYEGELLRRSAAMRAEHSSAALVATLAYPRSRNHRRIISRAAETFPDIGGQVHDLPLYLFKTPEFPSAADLTGELWLSAGGILDAVLQPHVRAASASAADLPSDGSQPHQPPAESAPEIGGKIADEEVSITDRPTVVSSEEMAGASPDEPAAAEQGGQVEEAEEAPAERPVAADGEEMAGASPDEPAAVEQGVQVEEAEEAPAERPAAAGGEEMAGAFPDEPAAAEQGVQVEEAEKAPAERPAAAGGEEMAGAFPDEPAAAEQGVQVEEVEGTPAERPAANYQQPAGLGQVVVGGGGESLPDKEIAVGIRIARSSTPKMIETELMKIRRKNEQTNIEYAKKRSEQRLRDLKEAGGNGFKPAKFKNKQFDMVGYLPGKLGAVSQSEQVKDSIGRTREAFGKLVK